MDRRSHVRIGGRRWGGFHMRDEMGRVVVTRLGRMRLVADPGAPALDAVAGLQIVWGMDQRRRGGHVSCLPPAGWVLRAVILLEPDLAEDLHREGGTDVRGGIERIRGLQEGKAIGAD